MSLKVPCEEKSELEQITRLFACEDKKLNNGRAEYAIKEDNLNLTFDVDANDAVALRAVITSITKTLEIYERTKKIVQE